MFDPSKPFNTLPELPPAADLDTKELLKKSKSARLALLELKLTSQLLPSQLPLIRSIPLREARDSSAIENVVTTDAKLFRYAAIEGADADPYTKETYRYLIALREGVADLLRRPITTHTAVKICQTIRNTDVDIRATVGTALTNPNTGEIIYTPPEGEELLRTMLANWEVYLNTDHPIDPLIKMAIAHYQFEAIHPFTDGNGRTGRVLNILYIMSEQLLEHPTLFLSSYILKHREDYYNKLLGVTANADWQEWILYMLDAVEETAKQTTELVRATKIEIDATEEELRVRVGLRQAREVAEKMFSDPFFTITDFVNSGLLGNRDTVSRHLNQFVQSGILRVFENERPKLFYAPAFLELLKNDDVD